MVFSLTEAIQKLPVEDREDVVRKVELVRVAQHNRGMEPRDDSQLTFNYALGLLDEDDVPSSIANELITVDTIHKRTEYAAIIEDVMREIADHIKKKYRLP